MLVFTRVAGITRTTGSQYHKRKMDVYGNIYNKCIERPEVAHSYFEACGTIDEHNKRCQAYLSLEIKWKIKNPWFCLWCAI